jgi:hypothetical protein
MRNPSFVPVRVSEAGTLALRTGRLLSGQRVGLAFTSAAALLSAAPRKGLAANPRVGFRRISHMGASIGRKE